MPPLILILDLVHMLLHKGVTTFCRYLFSLLDSCDSASYMIIKCLYNKVS